MESDAPSRDTSAAPPHDGAPAPIRRRLTGVLFATVGVSRTGFIAAITVTTLVAKDMLGSATFAGVPGAVAVLGSAAGGSRLAIVMDHRGRRPGMAIGHIVQLVGASIGVAATAWGSFPLLVVGLGVFGFGSSAHNLARYAAADVHPALRRGSAIAVIVWAGTIGSVLGPSLLAMSESLGRALGIEELAGGYVIAAAAAVVAFLVVIVFLRPDPLDYAERGDHKARVPREVRWSPTVRIAVTALAIGQVVMVLIMAMTPIHVHDHGYGLGTVGFIISAHTLGMFAVSPLTGMVADRIGRLPVILLGHGIMAFSGVLAAAAPVNATGLLAVALFLLGMGWNFSFIAGSALLTEGAPAAVRVRLQGMGDAVVWSSAAMANLSSGLLLGLSSYAVLCIVAAALTVVPAMVLLRQRVAPQVA